MTAVQSHTWTTLNLFSQFSTVSHPNHGYQHQQRPQTPAMNTTTTATTTSSYAAPAVISLGEEYTDATLPEHSSYLSLEEENGEEDDGGFMDYDDDACSTTSSEESSPCSPSSSRRNSARKSIIPALWHAEQARLINIQTAVLEKERRVRSRELKLESEVARIKTDLARLKQARTEQAQAARLSWLAANHPTTTTATTSSNTTSDSATTSPTAHKRTSTGQQSVNSTTTPASRVTGPRGPRPRPQPQTTTTTNSRSDATPKASLAIKFESEETVAPVEKARPESQLLPLSMSFDPTPPSLGKFNFEAAPFEEDHAVTESLLASHLTEARSARAQERHKRKIEHERIRELSMLLTLGSEVRKWEERLAWNQSRSRGTCSDDMSIIESGGQKEREDAMDTDPDPRFKRLSRSFSVPSRGSFVGPSPSASTDKKVPLPLPSLSDSPLWRVSAEMILRRGSRSERPRRPPVAPPAATAPTTSAVAPSAPTSSSTTLTRPSHVLRGPREQRSTNSASTSPSSSSSPASTTMSPSAISPSSQDGSSSVVPLSATSSGKRYSIPPPITIPSNTQFCNPTSNMAGVLPATAGATVSGQTAAGEAQGGEAETFKGFGERPAHPQSAQVYSGNNGFFGSRSTTPIKPSSLKWAFTADDLAKELESQKMENKKDGDVEMQSPTSSTSGESESDDSYKSSSEGSSQPVAAPQPVERRGRARFSWRRSIPKDSTNTKEEIPAVPPVHIGA